MLGWGWTLPRDKELHECRGIQDYRHCPITYRLPSRLVSVLQHSSQPLRQVTFPLPLLQAALDQAVLSLPSPVLLFPASLSFPLQSLLFLFLCFLLSKSLRVFFPLSVFLLVPCLPSLTFCCLSLDALLLLSSVVHPPQFFEGAPSQLRPLLSSFPVLPAQQPLSLSLPFPLLQLSV